MILQSQDSVEAENEARLRVVRYYSDVCSELVPDAVREQRLAQVRELEAKTDAELEELGIFREDIVDHVFQEAHFV
ncbi:hypothetical protein [Tropicimonas marinistellae]|uniref:hypothetical protein n=1 Tax=Tropicimonas marinistellae TaxID=1739787 RepID=UPI00082C2303|nr:hypothetical protein [Tropicimonas marinistellae]